MIMNALRQMHLNLFVQPFGHHEAAWRHPDTDVNGLLDFSFFRRLAHKAEAAKLDSLFFADRLSTSRDAVRYGASGGYEPLTLLTALAVVTKRIGLIGTVSTSFNEPFNLARRFASLDHLSGGRAGWNIITSGTDAEARNFNLEHIPEHAARYERAREFVDAAIKLWDSWEDGALVRDKGKGIYADSDKVHECNHRGPHFAIKGPLNVSRSPQGRPLLVQAGSSENGKEFAAEFAEAIFTAQQTFEEARSFYADLKRRAAARGRRPEHILILPGLCPIIGRTEEEARQKEEELAELLNPEYSLIMLSQRVGFDLTGCKLDEPLPPLPVGEVRGHRSRTELIVELARRERLTVRQLLHRLAGGRGHRTVTGTPEHIADMMEHWFRSGAADGFNIMPQLTAGGLDDFLELVVPELKRRGLFRTEYSGTTLREHYGLPQPENVFAAGRADRQRSSV
ncbi:NtaA/DmoA family FMN-dependent monooxygenase [Paenibacillus ginsengihumi]|uniref:LLM class flavin-dependent oxidoreductase n=1 Tax=Paenibacillus ginsengihumi TaxID=431596 RepID=UPI000363AB20